MTFDDFKKSLQENKLAGSVSPHLLAMWHDGKGNWEKAHAIIQDISDAPASWIHAYLHRKEGDEFNAAYWYERAGKPVPKIPVSREWDEIVQSLL